MRKLYTYFLLCTGCILHAQHFQFSQFYAAPTHLNPAFTGAQVCGRFTLNYRDQWKGIGGQFTTYQASFDHYFRKIKSGFGVQVLKDHAGPGNLTTTLVNFMYAYELQLNKRIAARAAISLGSVQRSLNPDNLIFGDQLEAGEGAATAERLIQRGATYADIGTGALVYSERFWGGLAISHLNKPNQSLLNNVSALPGELRLHGGYKFPLEEESKTAIGPRGHYVTIAANFKRQGKFNQFDIGAYYNKNLIVLGCWYRGIPLRKPVNHYENNDAAIFLIGIAVHRLKIGYSYDYTISSLRNARTNGTNELSLTWQVCEFKNSRSRRKKNVLISCPKF